MSSRSSLLRKYAVFFLALVISTLLLNGAIEIYFSYQENKAGLVAIQREKALAAAAKIEQFIKEIERQVGWASQPQIGVRATLEQRRFDFLRLLRQVPAVTEISLLDNAGREQLKVSRLAMDVVGSQADFSKDPRFTEARPGATSMDTRPSPLGLSTVTRRHHGGRPRVSTASTSSRLAASTTGSTKRRSSSGMSRYIARDPQTKMRLHPTPGGSRQARGQGLRTRSVPRRGSERKYWDGEGFAA